MCFSSFTQLFQDILPIVDCLNSKYFDKKRNCLVSFLIDGISSIFIMYLVFRDKKNWKRKSDLQPWASSRFPDIVY